MATTDPTFPFRACPGRLACPAAPRARHRRVPRAAEVPRCAAGPSRRVSIALGMVVALVGLVLAGCGSTGRAGESAGAAPGAGRTGVPATAGTGGPGGGQDQPGPTASTGLSVGAGGTARPEPADPARFAFEASTTDGATVAGASLAGRPALLWFWTPWCPICRGEAPEIARAHERYGDRVQFLGVAGLGRVENMRRFVDDTGLGGFAHLVDADGSLWARFGVPSQPAFAFVTRDGQVDVDLGTLSDRDLAARLDGLVAA